jgi:hypothetical protein
MVLTKNIGMNNMSLTSFIAMPAVREKFSETFQYPTLGPSPKLCCPPKTEHYGLVGTAFDYLLRFVIKAGNPNAITQQWVADLAVEAAKDTGDFERYNSFLQEAKDAYGTYLKTKRLDDKVIKAALLLAQLEIIVRSKGIVDPNMGKVEKLDIDDVRNLISSTKLGTFKSKRVCILNPTFGSGFIVGGADADMVIDDTLIEIKTVKDFRLDKRYYNQLIGYYILSKINKIDSHDIGSAEDIDIGGIDGYDKKLEIKNLAIYFSRYATFVNFKISDVMKGVDETKFISWFQKTALSVPVKMELKRIYP